MTYPTYPKKLNLKERRMEAYARTHGISHLTSEQIEDIYDLAEQEKNIRGTIKALEADLADVIHKKEDRLFLYNNSTPLFDPRIPEQKKSRPRRK